MRNELKELKKLYQTTSKEVISLKESDIDSLSLLLFSSASYEYIINNLLSKRKFNILFKYGVFEKIELESKIVKYKISPEYQNQVRDIYVKYYRMKYSK